jgi:hypothetical protein
LNQLTLPQESPIVGLSIAQRIWMIEPPTPNVSGNSDLKSSCSTPFLHD